MAERLATADVVGPVLKDDPSHPGIEFRLGSLRTFKRVQSVCPPTATLRKDGTLKPASGSRRRSPFLPEALLVDLIERCEAAKEVRAVREERRREAARRQALRDEPVPPLELLGKTPLERFLHALDRMDVSYAKGADGVGYTCSCTAADHDDRNPSMTFGERPYGRLSAHCWSRDCSLTEIMEGVGLRATDDYPLGGIVHRPTLHDRHPSRGGRAEMAIDLIQPDEAEAWAEEHERYARVLAARPDSLRTLAHRLGLPVDALKALEFGYRERNGRPCDGGWTELRGAWTWPEYNHALDVVGINRRFVDAQAAGVKKKLIATRKDAESGVILRRAARGLAIPRGFSGAPGPVMVVEGESDVVALFHAGHTAVGRPGNNLGNLRIVGRLFKDDPRDVVVLGGRDRKGGRAWPGDPRPVAK